MNGSKFKESLLIIALLLAVFIRVIPTYAEEEIISSEIETISSDSEGLSDSLDVVEEVFSKASSYDISSQFVAQVHEYNRKLVEGKLSSNNLSSGLRGTWAIISTTAHGLVSVPSGSVIPGASSYYVRLLQSSLNSLGYNAGTADGIYGPNTANAIKHFQSAQGITSDGIAGQITWAYIDIRLDTYGITVVF